MRDCDLALSRMVQFGKHHEVVMNRVKVVNDLHGCRYANGQGNPLVLRWRTREGYELRWCGQVVAAYGMYDVEGARRAREVADMLTDLLWIGRRAGYLVLRPCATRDNAV